MENFTASAARDTLALVCDVKSGTIDMEGISYPQDAAEFFNPVFEWLEKYIAEQGSRVTLNLRINYLNTSSTKCLFDLIDRMEEYHSEGGEVSVNWYYKHNDEDLKETGMEFQEDSELPFEIIPY